MSTLVAEINNLVNNEDADNIPCSSLLPEKSKMRYNQLYDAFAKWCSAKDIKKTTENVMMAYFMERSEVLKSPASLWSEYSMLKLTISIQQNEDISKFKRLKAFLKRKNDGYQPRTSKIFKREEIEKFIAEAPDEIYLLMKIVAIMGVVGACHTGELHKIKFKDIDLKDDVAIVRILETRNTIRRSFIITNNSEGSSDWLKLLQTYMKLRPYNAVDERLFFRYERGRCVNQVVGRNTISKVPREIAKYLKLDNVYEYTGRAFRKSSATFLSNVYDTFARSRCRSSNTIVKSVTSQSTRSDISAIGKDLEMNAFENITQEFQNSNDTQKSITFSCEDSRHSLSQESDISQGRCDSDYKYVMDDSEIHLTNEITHSPIPVKLEHRSDEESTNESTPSILTDVIIPNKKVNEARPSVFKNDSDLFFKMVAAKVRRFSPYHKNLIETKIFSLVQEMELEQIQQQQ
uniref:Uncharacterized protein n=1 Tax=Photinus pyralis TaxID=7054 RepID=A0A1Y1NDN0_PHOPY